MTPHLVLALMLQSANFWAAHWVDVPDTQPHAYGVYHFRKAFDLPAKPEKFLVNVSADNRYQLFINGTRVSLGPALSDLAHWRYETVDLAPFLVPGRNLLAAVVWNDGPYAAVDQVSNQTAFLLHAEAPENAFVDSGKTWLCSTDSAYSPQLLPWEQRTGYYALGPNEKFDSSQYPWGWETLAFDDSAWKPAHEITPGAPRFARDSPNRWMLVPREIPHEEQRPETLPDMHAFTVAANTSQTVLLDQRYLTTAYPELVTSGGAGATVTIRYAESLFTSRDGKGGALKGNRNETVGKLFLGPADTYISDGQSRTYRPLFWRTYRYIRLEIKTAAEPLTVQEFRGAFTGYPFVMKAQFHLPDSPLEAETQQILTCGFRTARLCAHETYMDGPFYEQLQYAGDARIQMMVSLYTSGDARLMKNGIQLLNSSRSSEGATYSRAPSELQQYIPPFSLWWIGMVHDYWMYVDDEPFVRQMLPGIRAVLDFYAGYQKANGSLEHMPWWNFVDWVKEWPDGVPLAEPDGSSAAALDLQLLMAYQWAADLEKAIGSKARGMEYTAAGNKLKTTILTTDWDEARGLFADQPSHRTYSQHVNTLAVLAHVPNSKQGNAVMQKVLTDTTLAQSSIYFRAYTNAALRGVGLGDRYFQTLGPWREMLKQGLTTWAEWSGPDARSDCHAWGASPNFEYIRTIAGIESAAPALGKVQIHPNPGELTHITAVMPHPKGEVKLELRKEGQMWNVQATLPPTITGDFELRNYKRKLSEGLNQFTVKTRR